ILVNGPANVWVERLGVLSAADVGFRDVEHIMETVERLLRGTRRRPTERSPSVTARLADGVRLHVVIPPAAATGVQVAIRKLPGRWVSLHDLVHRDALSKSMAAFMHAAVLARLNVLVTGAAGAGKTTVLGALMQLVPLDQRMVSLEDTHELAVDHPNLSALQVSEGLSLQKLVRTSLRMRPDRIVVGEVRGEESADMIQA